MSAKKIKTAYVAVAFDGTLEWDSRRDSWSKVQEVKDYLKGIGYTILDFEATQVSPLVTKTLATNSVEAFIQMADLVVYLNDPPFIGPGGIALAAIKKYNPMSGEFSLACLG